MVQTNYFTLLLCTMKCKIYSNFDFVMTSPYLVHVFHSKLCKNIFSDEELVKNSVICHENTRIESVSWLQKELQRNQECMKYINEHQTEIYHSFIVHFGV